MHTARFAQTFSALLVCGMLASPLWAGQARLVEADGPDRVVVDTDDASVDEVLAVLAGYFAFTVERSTPAGQTVRFSGRLTGSLDELLQRLLRHEGHMIVRSAEARTGIARVLLLDAKSPPPASTVAGPIAAIKAKLGLRQDHGAGK